MEVLAVALTILSFATSPIITKAINMGTRVPSFLYVHLPLLGFASCYGPDRFLSLLVFSIFLLVFTAGATIYVWLNDMW